MRQKWRFLTTVIGLIFRHPLTGTTIIPVLPNGDIVLVRRRDSGKWGLPGGLVDWGEDIPTAAKRELAEETALELTHIRRFVGVYSAPDRDPRVHSITISLEADVQGEMKVLDELEIMEIKAFPPNALPLGNLAHDHDRQLQDYFQGSTVVA